MPTLEELKMLQSLPLDIKIAKTKLRIKEWYEYWGGDVYVSFSGGKDSTVLLDIARQIYPDIEAVFADTGLEFPEVRKFAKNQENVTVIRPKTNFKEVIIKYGYPVISKEVAQMVSEARVGLKRNDGSYKYRIMKMRGEMLNSDGEKSIYNYEKYEFLLYAPFEVSEKCCTQMKKIPFKEYEKRTKKRPIIGTMAAESRLRKQGWLKYGCNAFEKKRTSCNPMSFWIENDILTYLHEFKKEYAASYGKIVPKQKDQLDGQMTLYEVLNDFRECEFCTTGCKRTGCIFCLFGITQDRTRIINLQDQEPKLADYVLRGGEFNEKGMWQPSAEGLGYWFVLAWLDAVGGIYIPFIGRDQYETAHGNEKTKKLLYAKLDKTIGEKRVERGIQSD